MSYVQYKNLVGEGEQYYTDVMDCPVCMANFRAQEIIIFSCGHAVCKDCFRELAQRNSKCPICRAELDVKLRVKLELGDRKVKPKKKSARRTKSLPNLKISRNSARDNNYYKYSANNNNKPTSRSLSRKSKKKKSPVRRALSNNIRGLELVRPEEIKALKEQAKQNVRNKSTRLLEKEIINEQLDILGKLKKSEQSPNQKFRKENYIILFNIYYLFNIYLIYI